MNYTRGPWVWDGDGGICQVGEPPYSYGKAVLRPTYEYDSGVDTEVSEEDARLIVAAPDMYEVLKAQEDLLQRGFLEITTEEAVRVRDMRRAAIAKAEGRS